VRIEDMPDICLKLSVLMIKGKSLVVPGHSKDYEANAIYRKLVTLFGDVTP
jgi:tagatose-1,6-bisphosphate aldolase non-catalytic subunit AgaZ/GatZ